jgi:predicted amidohydrolase
MFMKVACVQFDIAWENKPANYAKVTQMLREAKLAAGSLVLLPEMFSTGFSMNVALIAETKARETESFLSRTAKEFGVYLVAGIVTARDGLGRNEAVVFSPDGVEIARYCKMQPFNLGGEGKNYAAGNDIVTFQWNDFTVAPFICYDLRFPELFRAAAMRGAQLITVIASWPVMRIGHWVTLLQARAIENLAYVVGNNRSGKDPKLSYNGRSVIVNPHGDILADAGDGEKVISADVDVQNVIKWRADFPALADMRRKPIL